MLVTYPETLTLREARKIYFDANKFGDDGGYNDAWVDFKLGPIPMPFPNTASRVKAVRYHDLHHLLTGYDTNIVGEFEISGWEIAAGCKDFTAAWMLNLGGMAAGLFRAPRRVFAAFVRGRRERSLYGESFDELLDMTIGEVRAKYTRPQSAQQENRANAADIGLYALATMIGFGLAGIQLAIVVPLIPVGLVAHWMRKRARANKAAAVV